MRNILWAVVLAAFSSMAAAQQTGPLLFSSAFKAAEVLNAKDSEKFSRIKASKGAASVTMVSVDPNVILSSVISIPTPDGRVTQFVQAREDVLKGDKPAHRGKVWVGQSKSGGEMTIAVFENGLIMGDIHLPGGLNFELMTLSDDMRFQMLVQGPLPVLPQEAKVKP